MLGPAKADDIARSTHSDVPGALSRPERIQEVVLIRSFVLAALAAILALCAPSAAQARNHAPHGVSKGSTGPSQALPAHHAVRRAHHAIHRPGCRSRACDHRVDAIWGRHHRLRTFDLSSPTAFDICVANNEAGEPGSSDPHFIDWHLHDGAYSGAFQFDGPTWAAAGGMRYSADAGDATPSEQLRVFHSWEPTHPSAWPNTVPPCVSSG